MTNTPAPIQSVRWLNVQNVDVEEAPAFAILEPITDYTIGPPPTDAITSGGIIKVRKSTRDDNQLVLINGPSPLAVNGYGSATNDYPAVVLYDTDDGSPVNGEHWGAMSGSWKAQKGFEGFIIVGGAGSSRVAVVRDPTCPPVGVSGYYYFSYPPGCGPCRIIPRAWDIYMPWWENGFPFPVCIPPTEDCDVFLATFTAEFRGHHNALVDESGYAIQWGYTWSDFFGPCWWRFVGPVSFCGSSGTLWLDVFIFRDLYHSEPAHMEFYMHYNPSLSEPLGSLHIYGSQYPAYMPLNCNSGNIMEITYFSGSYSCIYKFNPVEITPSLAP